MRKKRMKSTIPDREDLSLDNVPAVPSFYTIDNFQVGARRSVDRISTYIITLTGMMLLWRISSQPHDPWSWRMLVGAILMGFGIFNLVEGIIDHQILGIHHVNEMVPPDQWIYWDTGFLAWGALMLAGGWKT